MRSVLEKENGAMHLKGAHILVRRCSGHQKKVRTPDEHGWAANAQDWNACTLVLISGLCSQGRHLLYSSSLAVCIPWPSCLILPICRGHRHECDTHLCIINIPVLGLLSNPQIYIKGTRLEGTNRVVHRNSFLRWMFLSNSVINNTIPMSLRPLLSAEDTHL